MRKLVVTENITIDGVIDASGGWFVPGDDTADLADVAAVLQQQSAASDALLLGRTTFEEMRAFWPNQTNDTTGSITLVHELIALGLVDEYWLFTHESPRHAETFGHCRPSTDNDRLQHVGRGPIRSPGGLTPGIGVGGARLRLERAPSPRHGR